MQHIDVRALPAPDAPQPDRPFRPWQPTLRL
jgi:hypothetical protein